MISTCTECQARYKLDATKVPQRLIKVRCPACSGVFALNGTQAAEPVGPPPVAAPSAGLDPSFGNSDPFAAPPPVAAPAAPAPASQPQTPVESPAVEKVGVAVLEETPVAAGGGRRRRPKEEMLARALVSDILVYNRELRDEALANGTLLEALGGEIKKSWELYKEKVTPEVANSSNHFREALNEILAEGDKIF